MTSIHIEDMIVSQCWQITFDKDITCTDGARPMWPGQRILLLGNYVLKRVVG